MGYPQSDLIIREAILAGLKEIRQNPTILEDMLEELKGDALSSNKYGDLTIDSCVQWFLNTPIKVRFGLDVAEANMPCIAIALSPTTEAESTLSDVDIDDMSEADPFDSTRRRKRLGLFMNETFSLAAFAHGEPEHGLFLFSVLMYSLLRSKFRYLESRNFIVSKFQVGPFEQMQSNGKDQIYTRSVTLTGKTRVVWYEDWAGPVADVMVNVVPDALGTPEGDIADFQAMSDLDILAGLK